MKSEDVNFIFGAVMGILLTLLVWMIVEANLDGREYKRGQTDALYGKWRYVRAKDAAGNDYVVEAPSINSAPTGREGEAR